MKHSTKIGLMAAAAAALLAWPVYSLATGSGGNSGTGPDQPAILTVAGISHHERATAPAAEATRTSAWTVPREGVSAGVKTVGTRL